VSDGPKGLKKDLTNYGDQDFLVSLRKAFIKGAGIRRCAGSAGHRHYQYCQVMRTASTMACVAAALGMTMPEARRGRP